MYRRQRSNPTTVNPTEAKILEAAVEVLNEDGFDRFSVQRVLERAGVSRATIYNHFGDIDSLIEAALVATFDQEHGESSAAVTALLEAATTADEFREGLRAISARVSRLPAAVRFRRVHTFALTRTRPELSAEISAVQDRLNAKWEHLIREAQRRGFVRPDLDPNSAAILFQSTMIGRIVDDVSSHPLGDDRWTATYWEMIERTLLTPDT